jgi:hypothetical protein
VRRLLIRCYPAVWRARYAAEFAAILEERPLGPFDVADVLLGALDAQLHLRGLRVASVHGKGFPMSLRIGGYAAIASGLLWLSALVGNAFNNGAEDGAAWVGLVIILAVITTLVALVGLSAFQARRDPALAWAAFAIPAIGGLTTLLGAIAMTITGDGDRAIVGELSGWAISSLGLLAMLVGSGLFAVATLRTHSLSREAAILLLVGTIVVLPGIGALSGGLVPDPLVPILLVATVSLFPAGWVALGISALRTNRPAVQGAASG